MIAVLCLLFLGCAIDSSGHKTQRTPKQTTAEPGTEQPTPTEWKDLIEVKMPEIIRILEEEDIERTETFHSGWIVIYLRNGSRYRGIYERVQAGKYSEVRDIMGHIWKQRPPEERWDRITE